MQFYRALSGLAIWYTSHYTKCVQVQICCTCLLKKYIKNNLKIGCVYKLSREEFSIIFVSVFNEKNDIFHSRLFYVGYEIIIVSSVLHISLATLYLPSHIQCAPVE